MNLKMSSSSAPYLTWKGITVAFLLLALTFPPTKSDGSTPNASGPKFGEKKPVLGSRPPTCLNKCFRCWPCKATLVITPRQARHFKTSQAADSDYYLLIWKCRCGNKLFHP